jgi:hypothetical protein
MATIIFIAQLIQGVTFGCSGAACNNGVSATLNLTINIAPYVGVELAQEFPNPDVTDVYVLSVTNIAAHHAEGGNGTATRRYVVVDNPLRREEPTLVVAGLTHTITWPQYMFAFEYGTVEARDILALVDNPFSRTKKPPDSIMRAVNTVLAAHNVYLTRADRLLMDSQYKGEHRGKL